MINPKRGEIWLMDLNPTRGQELQKTRPSLSTERFVRRLGKLETSVLQEMLAGLAICIDFDLEK